MSNEIKLTSNLEEFKKQLATPNVEINTATNDNNLRKLVKNIVLSYPSDSAGCGNLRCIFWHTFLNAEFGRTGHYNPIISPLPIFEPPILMRTRSIYFQRWMAPEQVPLVYKYKEIQQQAKFKMVWDLDDFIWKGEDEGEHIPSYNFGSTGITEQVRQASIEIMRQMDVLCVSTEFLGDYIKNKLKIDKPIEVIPNCVSNYLWGPERKKPIKNKIKKPKIIYTGSPTHWHNELKLKGDMNNAWCEWVIKNVMDNKIDFVQMGGLPFFFQSLVNYSNFKVIDWVNSYKYHIPIKCERADFGISPLVPNYFNYSKSDLKYIEYCAAGIVGIGTTFNNGKPSPYDNNVIKAKENITMEQIDELFDKLTEPEMYNDVINKQYQYLDINGRWMESPSYINRLMRIF